MGCFRNWDLTSKIVAVGLESPESGSSLPTSTKRLPGNKVIFKRHVDLWDRFQGHDIILTTTNQFPDMVT